MYTPKVTIIIPVYNGSNFLKEAIECALNQTYKNIEIVVVNDGSKDEGQTENIALSYGDKITYFLKENGGVSSALNYALKRINSEWFSWLSHDDLYYPQKIEKQIDYINKLLEENPNIELGSIVLHTATESIDRYGKVIKRPSYRDLKEKEDSVDVIISNIYNYRLSGCSFLLPTSCFKNAGEFREDIRTVSDVEYWYRLLMMDYQFYCLKNDILVKNRSHSKQVGKTKINLFDKEIDDLYLEIFIKFQKKYSPNIRLIEKFYFGLQSRKIYGSASFIFENYLAKNLSKFSLLVVNTKSFLWRIKGSLRNGVRKVFRLLFVK